jgi:hypothetical protein
MLTKLKTCLSNVAVVLSILGIITFSLFIFEEAIQMATFGTWQAQSTKDWGLVMEGADTIESINHSMKVVNYSVGWLQPLAFFSYRAYGKSTDYYVEALRKKVFFNSPESFVGRKVDFVFIPARIDPDQNKVRLVNGNLNIITDSIPETQKVLVSGKVERDGDLLVIRADSIKPVR